MNLFDDGIHIPFKKDTYWERSFVLKEFQVVFYVFLVYTLLDSLFRAY